MCEICQEIYDHLCPRSALSQRSTKAAVRVCLLHTHLVNPGLVGARTLVSMATNNKVFSYRRLLRPDARHAMEPMSALTVANTLTKGNIESRKATLQQLELHHPQNLTEHAAILLKLMNDSDVDIRNLATTLYTKQLEYAVKSNRARAVESALNVQREVEEADTAKAAGLLDRRPRLAKVHRACVSERSVNVSHAPMQWARIFASGRMLQQQSSHSVSNPLVLLPQGLSDTIANIDAQSSDERLNPSALQVAYDNGASVQSAVQRKHWDAALASSMTIFSSIQTAADLKRIRISHICLICMQRVSTRQYPCRHRCICDECDMPKNCVVCKSATTLAGSAPVRLAQHRMAPMHLSTKEHMLTGVQQT